MLGKLIMDARQVRMCQASQEEGFVLKGSAGLSQLAWAEAALIHLLDGDETVAEEGITRFIDRTEATRTDLLLDTVALVQ